MKWSLQSLAIRYKKESPCDFPLIQSISLLTLVVSPSSHRGHRKELDSREIKREMPDAESVFGPAFLNAFQLKRAPGRGSVLSEARSVVTENDHKGIKDKPIL